MIIEVELSTVHKLASYIILCNHMTTITLAIHCHKKFLCNSNSLAIHKAPVVIWLVHSHKFIIIIIMKYSFDFASIDHLRLFYDVNK